MKHVKLFEEFIQDEYENLNESVTVAVAAASAIAGLGMSLYRLKKRSDDIEQILKTEEDPKKRQALKSKLRGMNEKEIYYERKLREKEKEFKDKKDSMSEEDVLKASKEIEKLSKEKDKETKGWRKYVFPIWKR